MINRGKLYLRYSSFKRMTMLVALALICSFSAVEKSQAKTDLLIIDETRSYKGIGKDFTAVTKTRLSRMGYTILNQTKKLHELGVNDRTINRNTLMQSHPLRVAGNEVIILFLNSVISQNKIRVSAEAYSVAAQAFILSCSLPSEELYSELNCDEKCLRLNNQRLIARMGDEIADSIGNMLARENGVTDENGKIIAAIEIELIDFSESEKLQLLDLMTNEFPDFYRISKTRIYGPRHTLTYHSSANLTDLHKWIQVSMKQIGLESDDDFNMVMSAGRIDIIKNNIMLVPKNKTKDTFRFN